jgi:UDP-2,3-diacylglucosamine pyrophosphatase LpxH
MRQSLLVISDLHLGGDERMAICTAPGQALLADFLRGLAAEQAAGGNIHLIVNGDAVDFLAEPDFSPFTADDRAATSKLSRIIDRTEPVWNALAALAKAGGQITFTLGNHDLELSLPGPRRLLQQTLGRGCFEFIYDDQALVIGDVLIEHGNRYDRWNAVNHNTLREARVQASRALDVDAFTAPAGSRLVTDVMNGLKDRYRFINLLKPENQAAVPLLAVLDPSTIRKIDEVAALALPIYLTGGDVPRLAPGLESDLTSPAVHPDDLPALSLAHELSASDEAGLESFVAVRDFLSSLTGAVSAWYRRQQLGKLYRAFRYWLHDQLSAFDTGQESSEYLTPAAASARRGFRYILYGHTHLAKRIHFPSHGGTYLNTGTWADLMCVPASILLASNEDAALKDLEVFARDMEQNKMDRWVSRLPTFARIEIDDGHAVSGDVFIYEGSGKATPVPDGRLSRLLRGGE